VWAYIKARNLPYNALHDRGYPSIGCAPCTRAIEPGADPRSGRWWWENPDSRECGLQPRRRVIPLKVEPRRTAAAAAAT
jgi:phosphoadenosine phosphosulfate reductase